MALNGGSAYKSVDWEVGGWVATEVRGKDLDEVWFGIAQVARGQILDGGCIHRVRHSGSAVCIHRVGHGRSAACALAAIRSRRSVGGKRPDRGENWSKSR